MSDDENIYDELSMTDQMLDSSALSESDSKRRSRSQNASTILSDSFDNNRTRTLSPGATRTRTKEVERHVRWSNVHSMVNAQNNRLINEKEELNQLNERLNILVESIKIKKAQNDDLQELINKYREELMSSSKSGLKAQYSKDLENTKKELNEVSEISSMSKIRASRSMYELDRLKDQFDTEIRFQNNNREKIRLLENQRAESLHELSYLKENCETRVQSMQDDSDKNEKLREQLRLITQNLDREQLKRIDLECKIQTMQERKKFDQDVSRIMREELERLFVYQGENRLYDPINFYKNELRDIKERIRDDFIKLNEFNLETLREEYEYRYTQIVEEIETTRRNAEAARAAAGEIDAMNFANLSDEFNKNQEELNNLKMNEMKSVHLYEELKTKLGETQYKNEIETSTRDNEILALEEKINNLKNDLSSMLGFSKTLDAEVAVYARLLNERFSKYLSDTIQTNSNETKFSFDKYKNSIFRPKPTDSNEAENRRRLEQEELKKKQRELEENHKRLKELELEREKEREKERLRKQKENERIKLEREKAEQERIEREKQRVEQQRIDNEKRIERKRMEQERLEQERLERERQRAEQERIDNERRLERKRLEQERIERERLERERIENERRLERQRIEEERMERDRIERERMERDRIERERLDRERMERERLRIEQERLENDMRLERQRLEQERYEQERANELERLKRERSIERQKREQERLERERLEQERIDQERLEYEERFERQRVEQERIERERSNERKRLDQERLARERSNERKQREYEEQQRKRQQQIVEEERNLNRIEKGHQEQSRKQYEIEENLRNQQKLQLEYEQQQRNKEHQIRLEQERQRRLQEESDRLRKHKEQEQHIYQQQIIIETQRINRENQIKMDQERQQRLQNEREEHEKYILEKLRQEQEQIEIQQRKKAILEQQEREKQQQIRNVPHQIRAIDTIDNISSYTKRIVEENHKSTEFFEEHRVEHVPVNVRIPVSNWNNGQKTATKISSHGGEENSYEKQINIKLTPYEDKSVIRQQQQQASQNIHESSFSTNLVDHCVTSNNGHKHVLIVNSYQNQPHSEQQQHHAVSSSPVIRKIVRSSGENTTLDQTAKTTTQPSNKYAIKHKANRYVSGAIGILETSLNGEYIILENLSSNKNVNLKGWYIHRYVPDQNINVIFKFNQDTFLSSGEKLKILSKTHSLGRTHSIKSASMHDGLNNPNNFNAKSTLGSTDGKNGEKSIIAHNVDNWGTYSKFSVTKLINPDGVDKAVLTQSLLRMASSTSHVNAITGPLESHELKQNSCSTTNLNRTNLPTTYLDVVNVKTSPRGGNSGNPPIETISTTTTKKTVSSSSSSSHFLTTHSSVPVSHHVSSTRIGGPTFQSSNNNNNNNIHVTRQF